MNADAALPVREISAIDASVGLRRADASAPAARSGRPGHLRRLNGHRPQRNCAPRCRLWHDTCCRRLALAVAQAPRTRYAKCGDLDIAYQVLGDGPVDLLALPGPLVPFDSIDAEPSLYRFHRRLASFGRVIRFDQRGMGASSRSRFSDTIGPTFWAEDALAVMDAAGCEQATIVGSGWTGMSGLVLAADHPERVRNMVIVNGSARALWAPDYPIGGRIGENPWKTVALDPDAVEQGFDVLRIIAPSVADDDVFRRWWDQAGNRAQSPSEAQATLEVIATADLRDTLARITVPTLIMHRKDAVMIPVEHGRYLADHIAGSRYLELSGCRHPALDRRCRHCSRRDRGVRHRRPGPRRYRTCAHHNRFHRHRRLDAARRRTRRPPLARCARQSRPRRAPRTAAIPRPRGEHRGRRVRRDVHQLPARRSTARRRSSTRSARSASRSGSACTRARSRYAAPTSRGWRCTSVRGWLHSRGRARCWYPRRCVRSSRVHAARSADTRRARPQGRAGPVAGLRVGAQLSSI